MRIDIDTAYDFRCDTPEGRDPDKYSKTLRRYHKLLWSKRLPDGQSFELSDTTPGCYLYHRSTLGEFALSSDTVVPTFSWAPHIKALIPRDEAETFQSARYTIGGMLLFPENQIDGKWTINQARGCTRRIGDRLDLTLECVRRHYAKDESPLTKVLARYAGFFDLFSDFQGYVEFFLLQDIVSPDFSTVRISAPFAEFEGSPIPTDIDCYNEYKSAAIAFIDARNRRIRALA